MEVEFYLFEPKPLLGESDIVGEVEDSVEIDPFHAEWVDNNTINVLIS